MGLFRPPNIDRLVAQGNADGLVRATKSKDPETRAKAMAALVEMQERFIKSLSTTNYRRLLSARQALATIGPAAVPRLIEILGEGHVHWRQDAAFMLGEIGDPAAVPALCEALRHPDPMLRAVAAQALGKIADPAAEHELELATRDAAPGVAAAAGTALQELHKRAPRSPSAGGA